MNPSTGRHNLQSQAPAALPTRCRVLLHAIVIAMGWIVFVWFWALTTRQPSDPLFLLWLVGGAAVLIPAMTFIWILHNVGIYRRRGPRRCQQAAPLHYDADALGRSVVADWDMLRASAFVEVDVHDDGVKRYRPVSSERAKGGAGEFR